MRRSRLGLTAGLIVVASVAIVAVLLALPKDPHDARIAKLFGGRDGVAIVSHPSRVEAYRIGTGPRGIGATAVDHTVLIGPVVVPLTMAEDLSTALTLPASYGWGVAKGCVPMYGVRLSFHRGRDRVDVLLCMNCEMLLVARDGRDVSLTDFGPMRPLLVEAVTTSFPDDPAVQSLKQHPGKYVRGL